MNKWFYVILGVFVLFLFVAVPLLSQQAPRGQGRFQPGTGFQQSLQNLEKVLDNLGLTSNQKDLAMKIIRERADAFTKFMAAQANLARLAREIRAGRNVSDSDAKKALSDYYKEQAAYFSTIQRTEKLLRTLPVKAQVVILAPGFMGGRAPAGAGRQGPMGKGPMSKGPMGKGPM
ncbi:hypothetical protein H5T87_02550 [bacterium]|nr:hypothetical protein [bacterium]